MLSNTVEDKRTIILAVVLNLMQISVIVLLWNSLPAALPDHFTLSGDPTHWSAKSTLIILPLLNAFLCLICFSIWNNSAYFRVPWALTDANRHVQFTLAKTLIGRSMICVSLLFLTIIAQSVSYGLKVDPLPSQIAFYLTILGLIGVILHYYVQSYRQR